MQHFDVKTHSSTLFSRRCIRPQVIWCCLFFVLALNGLSYGIQPRPNIVVVLADDHAFEAISCYGSHLRDFAKTPAIDRLAREGVRFDNFACGNSICSPSRASILTGQYSHRNGVLGLNGSIHADSPQYPVELRRGGYQTWLVGKWHLKSLPKGYDKHMVVKGQGKYFDPTFRGSEGTWKRKGYSTDIYTDIALEWLRKRDADQPFLLCLQFKAPHHDYGHAARYDHLLANVAVPEPPTLYEDIQYSNSNLKRAFLHTTKFHMLHSGRDFQKRSRQGSSYYQRHLSDPKPNAMWKHDVESERDKIRVAYQHMIHKYIRCAQGNDDNLKRVLDFLDQENLAENTIVIYTSDQGYWLGQHGLYDKRLILETSMRMPFVIRYPRQIAADQVNSDLCMNVDIAPTLLDFADVEIPLKMQGQSMRAILTGEDAAPLRTSQLYTYWGTPKHVGVRTKRFTYVQVENHPDELFDRESDPHQLNNIARQPEMHSVIEELESELQNQIRHVGINPDVVPGLRLTK